MIINSRNSYNSYNPYNKKNNNPNQNANFSGKFFDRFAKFCNIDSNYSISREMFLVLSTVFMLGSRLFEARGEDERREVLTRDIPGIVISVYGASKLNNLIGHSITKMTGIPIIQVSKNEKKGWISEVSDKITGNKEKYSTTRSFATQKQLIDWYSNLGKLQNPLITFSETIQKHEGNIKKVMDVLGLSEKLKAITKKENATNEEIISALKKAQETKDKNFDILEGEIKDIKPTNNLLKKARNLHACLKIGNILMTAALLGYLLPRLNIVTTKKKYQDPKDNQIKTK